MAKPNQGNLRRCPATDEWCQFEKGICVLCGIPQGQVIPPEMYVVQDDNEQDLCPLSATGAHEMRDGVCVKCGASEDDMLDVQKVPPAGDELSDNVCPLSADGQHQMVAGMCERCGFSTVPPDYADDFANYHDDPPMGDPPMGDDDASQLCVVTGEACDFLADGWCKYCGRLRPEFGGAEDVPLEDWECIAVGGPCQFADGFCRNCGKPQ